MISKYNPKNERNKRDYLAYKRNVDGKDAKTVDSIAASISRLETYTGLKDFGTFNKHQATAFKAHLAKLTSATTGKPLALETQLSTLKDLQGFLGWLAFQPGYKSKIHVPDIGYLNMTDRLMRTAKSSGAVDFPSLEQVRHVVDVMPATTDIERRDRALVAFIMMTGIRDSAVISLKLKHFRVDKLLVTQDPREVVTKRGKWINTYFFPIDNGLKTVVLDWIAYLQTEKLFAPNDPMFPKTYIMQDENQCFQAAGLAREHWQTTQAVRKVFKTAFVAAGLPYYHPHSLRHTLSEIGQRLCKSARQWKAWTLNLGHDNPGTAFTSYGPMSPENQGQLLREIGATDDDGEVLAKIRAALGH